MPAINNLNLNEFFYIIDILRFNKTNIVMHIVMLVALKKFIQYTDIEFISVHQKKNLES